MQHPSVEGFWKFCSLRQEAYWLRQRGERHPDPAFRYHFCNVYREADRGTLFFRERMAGRNTGGDRLNAIADVLWFSVVYRLVNRIDTFRDWSERELPGRGADQDRWLRFLKERMAGGHKVFTGRHLNVGYTKYAAALAWLEKSLYGDGVTKGVAEDVRDALYLQHVVKAVERVPGVGTFFGWQVTCDLMEDARKPLAVHDESRWVHLGPGAWNALKLIFPDASRKDSVQLSVELWHTQKTYTTDNPVVAASTNRFLMVPPPQAPGPMSLKNVEHALCEYARYVRVIGTPEGKGVGLEVKKW